MNDTNLEDLLEKGDHEGAKKKLEELLFSDWSVDDEAEARILSFLSVVKAKNERSRQYNDMLKHALDVLARMDALENSVRTKEEIEKVQSHIGKISDDDTAEPAA